MSGWRREEREIGVDTVTDRFFAEEKKEHSYSVCLERRLSIRIRVTDRENYFDAERELFSLRENYFETEKENYFDTELRIIPTGRTGEGRATGRRLLQWVCLSDFIH